MSEPIFISEEEGVADATRWINEQLPAARESGATFFRVSHHPSDPQHLLLEGWTEQPAEQGEQRWQTPAGNA